MKIMHECYYSQVRIPNLYKRVTTRFKSVRLHDDGSSEHTLEYAPLSPPNLYPEDHVIMPSNLYESKSVSE